MKQFSLIITLAHFTKILQTLNLLIVLCVHIILAQMGGRWVGKQSKIQLL